MKKFLIGLAGAFLVTAVGSWAWGGVKAPNSLAAACSDRVEISQVALTPVDTQTTVWNQQQDAQPLLLAWDDNDECGCEGDDGDDDDSSSIGVGVGVGISAGGSLVVVI